jgi:hypothetical protein
MGVTRPIGVPPRKPHPIPARRSSSHAGPVGSGWLKTLKSPPGHARNAVSGDELHLARMNGDRAGRTPIGARPPAGTAGALHRKPLEGDRPDPYSADIDNANALSPTKGPMP